MKNESILIGVIGLFIGGLITLASASYAVNSNNNRMMSMMGMRTSGDSYGMMNEGDMSMSDMTGSLNGKNGEEFDEAFINMMIIHHQGAINMARLAQNNAKHDEIKGLANDIISSQTKEIEQMKTWQDQWNYEDVTSNSGSN